MEVTLGSGKSNKKLKAWQAWRYMAYGLRGFMRLTLDPEKM